MYEPCAICGAQAVVSPKGRVTYNHVSEKHEPKGPKPLDPQLATEPIRERDPLEDD